MELRLLGIALALTPALFAAPSTPTPIPPLGEMRHAFLQDGTPYQVGIGNIPTTIMMPGPIEAFEGTNITTTPNTVAVAFLQHKPGSSFFSVKALLPGVADLNVILNGTLYSFRFAFSDNPTRTLVIAPVPAAQTNPSHQPLRLTPRRLYDLVQDAKTYFLIKQQHPELIRPIEVSAPGTVLPFGDYTVVIDQVFRFEADDTLVFRAIILNDSVKPLTYSPGDIALRVGANLYWPSFAQLSGAVPSRQPAHLAYELSPDATATLTLPDGTTYSLPDGGAAVGQLGTYCLTVTTAKGKKEKTTFDVKYPVPAGEPNPLIVANDKRAPGLRKLTVTQPTPGQAFGYICYSGTADGQRANLSINQNFALLVQATPAQ